VGIALDEDECNKPDRANKVTAEVGLEEVFGVLNETEQWNAPQRIWVSGKSGLLSGGRRACLMGETVTPQRSLLTARKLASRLARERITLVSGLAPGIDEASLMSAIDAGGTVIGLVQDPLSLFYPRSLRKLARVIRRDHLLMAPGNLGKGDRKREFSLAGAIAPLISDAVVMVDAAFDSEVLKQGWEAIRLGRPLYLCRELIEESLSSDWPEEMIDHGAKVLTDRNFHDELIANLPEVSRAEFAAFTFDD